MWVGRKGGGGCSFAYHPVVLVAEAVAKQRKETFRMPGDQKPDNGPDHVKGRGGLARSLFRAGAQRASGELRAGGGEEVGKDRGHTPVF